MAGEGAGDRNNARHVFRRAAAGCRRSDRHRPHAHQGLERAAASRKRARKAAKAAAVTRLRKGEEPDDDGNWAVRRIVEVIRFKGRGRRVDVKVEWEGVDEQGRPWADSWLRMGKLSIDLRKDVWQRLEAE